MTTTQTKPDETRLFAVLDRIRQDPDSLDMRFFYRTGIEDVCGTTKCFAGHAIDLFGERFSWNADVPQSIGGRAAWSVIFYDRDAIPEGVESTHVFGGYEVAAAHYAAALLGLNETQTEALFYYLVDDVDVLTKRVQQIIDGTYDEQEDER